MPATGLTLAGDTEWISSTAPSTGMRAPKKLTVLLRDRNMLASFNPKRDCTLKSDWVWDEDKEAEVYDSYYSWKIFEEIGKNIGEKS